MNQNFYNFVSWLNSNHGKLTNRQVIDIYYNQLENLIKNSNLIERMNTPKSIDYLLVQAWEFDLS